MARAFLDVDRRAHLHDSGLYQKFYEKDSTPGVVYEMPATEPRLTWVLSHIGPHDDVLDIGCHKGEMTQHLPSVTDGHVLGCDVSKNAISHALAVADRLDSSIGYFVSFAEDLKVMDNEFDVAILCEILEHVPDPRAVIREAERVVRNGGKIIVSTPCDAIKIDRHEAPERDRLTGMALDMHVREYDPAVELWGKPDLVVERGNQQNVKAGYFGIDQWLACFTVRK